MKDEDKQTEGSFTTEEVFSLPEFLERIGRLTPIDARERTTVLIPVTLSSLYWGNVFHAAFGQGLTIPEAISLALDSGDDLLKLFNGDHENSPHNRAGGSDPDGGPDGGSRADADAPTALEPVSVPGDATERAPAELPAQDAPAAAWEGWERVVSYGVTAKRDQLDLWLSPTDDLYLKRPDGGLTHLSLHAAVRYLEQAHAGDGALQLELSRFLALIVAALPNDPGTLTVMEAV